jgi:transcriptional regulator with XRE-family HTH domain
MKSDPVASAAPFLRLNNRIREARAQAGMTKGELARRVGVCTSAVVQWELANGTAPTVPNLAKVAQATEVAFEWLATGRGPMRIRGEDGPPVVDPSAIATTIFEERLLQIARRLPIQQHEPLLEFLEAWAGKATK